MRGGQAQLLPGLQTERLFSSVTFAGPGQPLIKKSCLVTLSQTIANLLYRARTELARAGFEVSKTVKPTFDCASNALIVFKAFHGHLRSRVMLVFVKPAKDLVVGILRGISIPD